jgi:hypothetical protein
VFLDFSTGIALSVKQHSAEVTGDQNNHIYFNPREPILPAWEQYNIAFPTPQYKASILLCTQDLV